MTRRSRPPQEEAIDDALNVRQRAIAWQPEPDERTIRYALVSVSQKSIVHVGNRRNTPVDQRLKLTFYLAVINTTTNPPWLAHVGGPVAVRGIAAGARCAPARFVITVRTARDARAGVPLMPLGITTVQEDP